MVKLNVKQILEATNGVLLSGDIGKEGVGVVIDSRKVELNNIFVAIKGENFDAHSFLSEVVSSGVSILIVQQETESFGDTAVIKVEDTRRALGDIAKYYRSLFNIPFIGVTGSVGKTSTRRMMGSVLSEEYNVLENEGNLNNDIGVPLTLFRLSEDNDVGVVEMGMNHLGEIEYLSKIAKPKYSVITNIGTAHIGNLGSKQNILKAKLEIIKGMDEDGVLIINGDESLLSGLKGLLDVKTIYYGLDEGVDFRAYNIDKREDGTAEFNIKIDGVDYLVHIPAIGIHNVYNALAAIVAGKEMGMSVDNIISGISKYSPVGSRSNIYTKNGITFIDDVYNASVSSMNASIDVLSDMSNTKRKIAILGDMYELGEFSQKLHREVGEYIATKDVDFLFTVGEDSKYISDEVLSLGVIEEKVKHFDEVDEVAGFLKEFLVEDDIILVKGSRGMAMERIIKKITEN